MTAPKKGGLRLVSYYRAVNKHIEKVPGVMPNQEAEMADLRGATCFGKLDMLQGYWQIPLTAEAQEVFTIATLEGLFTPTRVPQGGLNATAYFQGVMTELLAGLKYKVWVDGIVLWGADEDDLLNTLDTILGCLKDAGLFAAAHKCLFFDTEISWCGKVYSGGQVFHDRERSSGLASMRRPQTAGELMQFLQAVNWLRASLPRLAEVVEPLRVLLAEHMGGIQRRTKRVASNRAIAEEAWKSEQVATWSNVQDLVANAVALSHPKDGYEVLMFPDASHNHWGSFLTQVPKAELEGGVEVEKMNHEPLGFLSGTFRGSQQRWATVDKEGFAIVITFRRLEYSL